MKQIITIFTLTILVFGSAMAQYGGRAKSLIEKGKSYYKEKNYVVAKQYFDLAIELEPDNPLVLAQKALVSYKEGSDSTNAIDFIDKAIALDSKNPYYYTIRADINNHFENYEAAIEDCNKALELNTSLEEAYGNRSIAYWYLKHKEQAHIDLDKVISLTGGTDAKAYHNKAIYYKDDRDYPKALEYFNLAIQLDANYSFAYYNRAKLYVMMTYMDKACSDFQKAIELGLSDQQEKVANQFLVKMQCLISSPN
jgi:tetratricopeptide (TPR) repeat protein